MSPNTHHTNSPSALNGKAQCVQFAPDPVGGPAAAQGTLEHEALEMLVDGVPDQEVADKFDNIDLSPVLWARDWLERSYHGVLVNTEEKMTLLGDDFSVITEGTIDIVEPLNEQVVLVADYKSGEIKDHSAQLDAYAAMACERYGCQSAIVVVLYGRYRDAQVREIPAEDARANTVQLIERIHRGGPATACDACTYCSKRHDCAARQATTNIVLASRGVEQLFEIPIAEIEDGKTMAMFLDAVSVAEKAVADAKTEARSRATQLIDAGVTVDGYEMRSKRGTRSITDATRAYELSGLSPEAFMKCVDVSITKLEKTVAQVHGIAIAKAKRDLAETLNGLIVTGPGCTFLQKGVRSPKQIEIEEEI